MSEAFDPYLKWFGIPLKDHPVNHYRLLAIEVFEADPEVIENAADQRMAHLKRFNTGKHSALAEKLLNEVAAARVCLLNPAKKATYDDGLRQQLARHDSAAQEAMPVTPPPIAEKPAYENVADFLTPLETAPSRAAHVAKRKDTPWIMVVAVVAALAAVVVIVRLTSPKWNSSGRGRVAAKSTPTSSPTPTPAPAPGHTPTPLSKPAPAIKPTPLPTPAPAPCRHQRSPCRRQRQSRRPSRSHRQRHLTATTRWMNHK